jgi:hypothetical protein
MDEEPVKYQQPSMKKQRSSFDPILEAIGYSFDRRQGRILLRVRLVLYLRRMRLRS